ncbi:MAG: ABC transporter ATP-binding protein [Candidatus Brocadiia bacterium]
MELLRLQDVYKTYHLGEIDLPVLKGITLSIDRSELVALMGVSGSGKSTLMNIIGCLDHPTSGKYWLDGNEISEASANERADLRNRMIGFVFQTFNLLSRTSALENVMMPIGYSADSGTESERRQRASELLTRVGLGDRMDHEPSQLSGGQQQRVAIARALINRPQFLLADEPTGNLDSRSSVEILRMFEELNREQGITILLVTHDPGVAEHAKRIIRIRDGVIGSDGAASAASAAAGDGAATGTGGSA